MLPFRPTHIALATATVLALGLVSAPVVMADSDDVPEGFETVISMEQAIKIAEDGTSGKATEVELESEDGVVVYEVEVTLSDGTEKEMLVDAMTGALSEDSEEDEDKEAG